MYDKGLISKLNSYPSGGAYAPQTNDGYGVFYLYLGDNFSKFFLCNKVFLNRIFLIVFLYTATVHISSYRSNPKTDSKLFGEKLQESMKEIKDLLR